MKSLQLRQFVIGMIIGLCFLGLTPRSVSACANAGSCGPQSGCDYCRWVDNYSSWNDIDCGPFYPTAGRCVDHEYDFYQGPPRVENGPLQALMPTVNAQGGCWNWCDWGWCQGCEQSA